MKVQDLKPSLFIMFSRELVNHSALSTVYKNRKRKCKCLCRIIMTRMSAVMTNYSWNLIKILPLNSLVNRGIGGSFSNLETWDCLKIIRNYFPLYWSKIRRYAAAYFVTRVCPSGKFRLHKLHFISWQRLPNKPFLTILCKYHFPTKRFVAGYFYNLSSTDWPMIPHQNILENYVFLI